MSKNDSDISRSSSFSEDEYFIKNNEGTECTAECNAECNAEGNEECNAEGNECDICQTVVEKEDIINECRCKFNICLECYKRVLTICFCRRRIGEILFVCPNCRTHKYYENSEVIKVIKDKEMCFITHAVCQKKSFIRKCKFLNCGCRKQIKDVVCSEPFTSIIQKYMN